MEDVILIIAVVAVMIFGFFIMKRLDVFLEANRKAIENEQEEKVGPLEFIDAENYENMIAQDWKSRVNDDDVVLICGDLCWAMKIESAGCLYDYLAALPGKKIVIRGNHDYWWKSISAVRDFLPSGCYALQNDAVKIGISINAFWTMTVGEISIYFNAYNEKEKQRQKEIIATNYNLASLISSFINRTMSGKQIPGIYELYPDLFEAPLESWEIYKAQFADFADKFNKQRGGKK